MARFVFPLQPLLDERRRKEEEKRLAFVRVKAARDERSRELGRLARALRARGRALHECALTGSAANLRLYDANLRYLECALQSHEKGAAETSAAFDRAAAELLDANCQRRLIEKLKERRLQAFECEEARRDELELDEANSRRTRTVTLRQAQGDARRVWSFDFAQDDSWRAESFDFAQDDSWRAESFDFAQDDRAV